ncbi:hypothetical protein CWB79_22425 [Pseudoalteromonas sp. S1649]|nr:hypothetical protein CWB79_22425 [Pseudoalteromonas sp. S1649]
MELHLSRGDNQSNTLMLNATRTPKNQRGVLIDQLNSSCRAYVQGQKKPNSLGLGLPSNVHLSGIFKLLSSSI